MKPGQASQTAVIVCMGRAAAHGTTSVARFSDPTASALLPAEARARVERFRAGVAEGGIRGKLARTFLDRRAKMMVTRTVAIDDAVRAVASPQVVILGAGLDGRAWRMPELRDAIVFEVDHPDSQRDKQTRITTLTQAAREVRFVPVDFVRDKLDDALAAAGHDATRPTTWIWEGVVMYLTPAEVESSLAVIARRSAPASRLIIAYFCPALILHLLGFIVRRVGEPLRSTFTVDAMRALLAKHGFTVVRDEGLPAIGAALGGDVAQPMKGMKHMHIVTAER
jgi:methyltransferase (TIGR00027 family)